MKKAAPLGGVKKGAPRAKRAENAAQEDERRAQVPAERKRQGASPSRGSARRWEDGSPRRTARGAADYIL